MRDLSDTRANLDVFLSKHGSAYIICVTNILFGAREISVHGVTT